MASNLSNRRTKRLDQLQLKQQIRDYWEAEPCGSADSLSPVGTHEFFRNTELTRATRDPFMRDTVGFGNWRGKSVLEVGCGMGMDLVQFARAGAHVSAVDLTEAGVAITTCRLRAEALPGKVIVADAEALPFHSNEYDFVYSWGVIHATPDTLSAAREMVRVCKPGGRVLAMVYNRYSLVSLQAWLVYGLRRGRMLASPNKLIAEHVESPGMKVYSRAECARLFPTLQDLSVQTIVTSWDLRIGRRRFLPSWLRRAVPSRLGWFMIIQGTKPA